MRGLRNGVQAQSEVMDTLHIFRDCHFCAGIESHRKIP